MTFIQPSIQCLTVSLSFLFCLHSQDREERAVKSAPQPLLVASTITTATNTTSVAQKNVTNATTSVVTNNNANNSNVSATTDHPSTSTSTATNNNTIITATGTATTSHPKSAVSPQESIQEEPEPESMIKRILALKAKEVAPAASSEKVTPT